MSTLSTATLGDLPLLTSEREAIFWSRASRDDNGCLIWHGTKHCAGYGTFSFKNKAILAHRLSWVLSNPGTPEPECVCHHCDVRPCIEPTHLFGGSRADNLADMRAKGREVRGEKMWNSHLTAKAVREIRKGARAYLTDSAEKYGVERGAIRNVLVGMSWKHVE